MMKGTTFTVYALINATNNPWNKKTVQMLIVCTCTIVWQHGYF